MTACAASTLTTPRSRPHSSANPRIFFISIYQIYDNVRRSGFVTLASVTGKSRRGDSIAALAASAALLGQARPDQANPGTRGQISYKSRGLNVERRSRRANPSVVGRHVGKSVIPATVRGRSYYGQTYPVYEIAEHDQNPSMNIEGKSGLKKKKIAVTQNYFVVVSHSHRATCVQVILYKESHLVFPLALPSPINAVPAPLMTDLREPHGARDETLSLHISPLALKTEATT